MHHYYSHYTSKNDDGRYNYQYHETDAVASEIMWGRNIEDFPFSMEWWNSIISVIQLQIA